MSPKPWPDAERKKALIRKQLTREGDVSLFIFQWIEHLERRIEKLERKAVVNSILVKPKPST
jgi:hypothetical protein